MNLGNTHASINDHYSAIAHFEKLRDLASQDTRQLKYVCAAHLNLGLLHYKLDNTEQSVENLKKHDEIKRLIGNARTRPNKDDSSEELDEPELSISDESTDQEMKEGGNGEDHSVDSESDKQES